MIDRTAYEHARARTDVFERQIAAERAAWITGSAFHRREAERLDAWLRFLQGRL